MNKKFVAIVVVAALMPVAAMAEVTVYGRIHASLDSVSGIAANTNNLTLNDNSSRFGVKGSQALDGGLTALFQLETGASYSGTSTTFAAANRDSYTGLTGGFGTFLAGRLPAANQYVYDSNMFADQLGDAANFTGGSLLGIGRAVTAMHYVAPNMGGVTVALTYLPASSVTNTLKDKYTAGIPALGITSFEGKNSYAAKVSYAGNGVSASLTMFNVVTGINAGATEVKVAPLSLSGGYDFGMGQVTAQYVKSKTTAGGTDIDTTKVINVGAKFKVSDADAAKVQFSKASASSSGGTNGASMLAVGFDHSLSKSASIYVVYAKVTNDAGGTYTMNNWGHQVQGAGPAAGEDPAGFGVGLTQNF